MKRVWITCLFVFSAVCSAGTTTLTLPVLQDTYVDLGSPNTNFGTATSLVVSRNPSGELNRIAFLQFDLSRIYGLEGRRILSATLKLHQSTGNENTGQVGRVLQPWKETEMTYNTAPQVADVSGAVWDSSGSGDYDTTADLTELVRNWVTGAWPNYGIRLRTYGDDGYIATFFDSMEEKTARNLNPLIEVVIEGTPDGIRRIPLNVIKDSYTDPSKPDTNFGTSNQLYVARDGASNREIWMEFETTGLIGIDTDWIDTAYLKMHRALFAGAEAGGPIGRITQPWQEGTITFNTKPTVTEAEGAQWAVAGGDGYNTVVNVNDFVRNWADGVYPNYGLKLRQYSGPYSLMIFDSKEETTRKLPPMIEVTLKSYGSYDVPWWVGSVGSDAVYVDPSGNTWKFMEVYGRDNEFLRWSSYSVMKGILDGSIRCWQGVNARALANTDGRLGRISGFYEPYVAGVYSNHYDGAIVVEPIVPGLYSWYGRVYCRVWSGSGPVVLEFVRFSATDFPTHLHTETIEEGNIFNPNIIDLSQIAALQNISLKAGERLAMVARTPKFGYHVVAEFETPVGIVIAEGGCAERPIDGDLNGDCNVDSDDLFLFSQQWLHCSDGTDQNCF